MVQYNIFHYSTVRYSTVIYSTMKYIRTVYSSVCEYCCHNTELTWLAAQQGNVRNVYFDKSGINHKYKDCNLTYQVWLPLYPIL